MKNAVSDTPIAVWWRYICQRDGITKPKEWEPSREDYTSIRPFMAATQRAHNLAEVTMFGG